MPSIDELIADPQWFPEALEVDKNIIRFARIGRERLAREAFLDERMTGADLQRCEARLADLLATFDAAALREPTFIFHSAFCCSTLLARALDAPGRALALKEPRILMDVANAIRVSDKAKASPGYVDALCRLIFGLLARPHEGGESIVIKPTNSANNLLPYAVKLNSKVLLLYGDLRSFLVSILKKGEQGRAFARRQFNIFSLDPGGLSAIHPRQAVGLTDLQIAALVWRHQIELFQHALAAHPGPVASLDFRVLLAARAPALKAVARKLGLGLAEAMLEDKATGEIFMRNAKFADEPYDAKRRDIEGAAIEGKFREELDVITKWASTVSLGMDVRLPLPAPVLA